MKIVNRLADRFARVAPLPSGTFQLRSAPDAAIPFRLHLRLRPDGSAILVVNASTVLQLNPTAAEFAYHYVRGVSEDEAAREVAGRYRISRQTAREEYRDFVERIESLVTGPDLDPVAYLDFDRIAPHSAALAAPLRLDCALTYRVRPGAESEGAAQSRVRRELGTGEWKLILDKAWQAGVPHVVFTGGEPSLRDDLLELVAHAEANGQVCGLLTNGIRLADRAYLQALLQTGLDHVLMVLQPALADSWKAVDALIPEDIFVTVHLTLRPGGLDESGRLLTRLMQHGVRNVSLTASEPSLARELAELRNRASEMGLSLRWDLPVPYSEFNPVSSETVADLIRTGAGKVWLYVEPDGDVLPAQGAVDDPLGNLLTDAWESIGLLS